MISLRYNNEFVSEITSGQQAGVLLDQTCFYAEAGGQIYDIGFLSKTDDEVWQQNGCDILHCSFYTPLEKNTFAFSGNLFNPPFGKKRCPRSGQLFDLPLP